jgi:low temperature requirement protein LtrA
MLDKDEDMPKSRTFLQSYWQPPRPHGEVIEGRSVSSLELFYDLVYVVVIAQVAHHLAEYVTWRGALEFAVVFGMIWLAWMNGTVYARDRGPSQRCSLLFCPPCGSSP